MLGLVGIHLYDHENGKAHCTINPETLDRINLQPWTVVLEVPGTKDAPPKTVTYVPATEEDFKAIIRATDPDGKKKNPLIGVLPPGVAEVKKKMLADDEKKMMPAEEKKFKKAASSKVESTEE